MAFVLKQSDTYTWPITVETPADGGKIAKAVFDGEFRRLTQTKVNDLIEAGKSGAITDRDVCREVLIGWSGVTDGENDVAFSEAALVQLLDVPGVERGVLAAWFESLAGAKRKN